VNLIYIGDRFITESSRMMSDIYTTDGEMFSWEYVKTALRNGEPISIRPATPEEIVPFDMNLKAIRERWSSKKKERVDEHGGGFDPFENVSHKKPVGEELP